jgi:sulfatase maturation enzyme AslB (radical SAM superfamily)
MYRRQAPLKEKLGELSISDCFQQPDLIQLRKDIEDGVRNPGCTRCWQEEDGGKESKRTRDNEKYHNMIVSGGVPYKGISYLELNLGNECNLRCRTCGPHSSSQWVKEAYDIQYFKVIDKKRYSEEVKQFHKTYAEDSAFWPDFEKHLPTIRQLDFYGGEPFMSKKMWHVLRVAVEKGYAKDIELNYATNGSFWPEEVEIFKHFRRVSVQFSIDGIGNQFEFMRYLSDWKVVTENMTRAEEFRDSNPNVFLGWCITLSALNVYQLPEILLEHHKNYSSFGVYLNLVHFPNHFNISIMPENVKVQVLEKINSFPSHYQSYWHKIPGITGFIEGGEYNETDWIALIDSIRSSDVYRNQDYAEIFPEFANIIGYKK